MGKCPKWKELFYESIKDIIAGLLTTVIEMETDTEGSNYYSKFFENIL